MPSPYQAHPTFYGAPDQFVGWVESAARLVELEPDEVFNNAGVKEAMGRLRTLIARRVDGPPVPELSEERRDRHGPTQGVHGAVRSE